MLVENDYDEHRGLVDAWLREYVSVSDPRVGRSGPVCPFIPRALNERAVETRIRSDIDGSNESRLVDELQSEISIFGSSGRPRSSSGVLLDSRVIVMPRMGPTGWNYLDAVYGRLKDWAVNSGKMVGLFHPDCDDRAVRNSDFRVSVAPVAMLAIRYMAPHDILFLNDSRQWFRKYDTHFRSYFINRKIRDPLLVRLYNGARDRFDVSP